MSKKKAKNNIPDDDLIKTILEDVNAIDESTSDFNASESAHFVDESKSFSPTDIFDLPTQSSLNSSSPSDDSDFMEGLSKSIKQNPESSEKYEDNNQDDKTVALETVETTDLPQPMKAEPTDAEKTIAVTAFAKRKITTPATATEEKVIIGTMRPATKSGLVHTSVDASLAQAENLKIAQQRIIELEKELDRLRGENEELASAGQIIHQRSEELNSKILSTEKEKKENQEIFENEISLLQGNLRFKEIENQKSKSKIEELETRLKNDFKKIRVRERELENRLELARAEKQALVRAKDDHILDLQRKIDQMRAELTTYREKVQELNKTVEAYQDQMKRTVRALRLALTNLEVKDESFIAFKKAD